MHYHKKMKGGNEMKNIVKVAIRISALAIASALVVSGCSKPATQEKKPDAAPSSTAVSAAKAWAPDKPVTIIVNTAPGGTGDMMARTVEKVWSKYSNVPVLIVNKPGAGGVEGATFVQRAKPDGYTLASGYGGGMDLVMGQLQKMEYDPFKALDPIACVTVQPTYIIVPTNSPFNSLKDIVDWGKKENKPITCAIGTALNSEDLSTRGIAKATGITFTTVPHAGGSQAITTLLGGNTLISASSTSSFVGQYKSKQIKAIGQSLDGRDPMMSDVPSFKEQGIPFVSIGTVKGIAAPMGLPTEIKAYYDELFKKITSDEEFKKAMADTMQPTVYKNSSDFKTFFKQAYEDYGKLIKDLGIEQKK
jgi:tripartite-type tricarboxylate transporter receptor subunit TctC